jgi:phage virion morphogenesis protein
MRRVSQLRRDIKHVERPMKAAGTYMIGSIVRNFNAGGRPKKWQKLAASTVRQRRRGKGRGGIKVLVNMGQLRNSHSMRLRGDGVEVGTNMVQAKRQHFGYHGGKGRGRSKTPARPFVMFQEEDPDAIGQIFMRHISRR